MDEINAQMLSSKIPKIRALTLLARGGQKIVYSGFHEEHGKVAVKLIVGAQPDRRIMREIEVATACQLPNTAALYKWGTIDSESGSILFIVEEFIEGDTLRQELLNRGRLPLETVLELIGTLLDTAVAMEREGIVHRDVKPENIMMCPDGRFRLLDFGIARRCNWCGIYIEEAGPAMRRVRLGKEAWYVRVDVEPADGLCAQCTYEEGS